MDEREKEIKRLKNTIQIIENDITIEKKDLEKLYKDFYGDREELWRIADLKKIHIKNLESSHDNPYFARIDFTYEDDSKQTTIYIGKNGVMKDNEIVVTDWRASISSLYYDGEIGKCQFEAPMGTINGEMSLKRQYEIEKGELIDFFDVNLVSNDALLQKYLNLNNDARLKSIVATIQKEQNDVIRKGLNENLIIQGVAGSGKTTVALHRIAYLVYNYMKSIKQSQYLVIGPNPVFLKYIKSVLPELDVSGVSQFTFEQLAKDYIDEDINITSSSKKVTNSINGKKNNDVDKFKCYMEYKNLIDIFMKAYFQLLVSSDLMLGNFKVLDKSVIEEIFNSTENTYSKDLKSRIDITINRLCRIIEDNKDKFISKYGSYSFEEFKKANSREEMDNYRKMFAKERNEIEKNCRSIIKKYFSKAKIDSTKLYKIFIQSLDEQEVTNFSNIKLLKKETLQKIKNNEYDFEDLSALMYIKSLISTNKAYEEIRHVVIDEAQDLGEFNFTVLKKCLPKATFSIFGDLAQSIYDYRGIDSWNTVKEKMFNDKANIVNFNKSYRTTAEIMEVADNVSDSIGLGKSDLVVRHGNPVEITSIDEKGDMPQYIFDKVKEYISKGYKTIAIISKTDLLSNYINDDLNDLGLNIPNVAELDDLSDDRFRVCTISNQLSKGLEFDAVIINGASEEIYSSDSNLDMKLLYVAITRALHEIDIVYNGELTSPLKPFLKKKDSSEKKLILKK